MKVLQVSSAWPPDVIGGAELYAARLSEELRAAGHEVGVVTFGVDGDGVVASAPAWPYPLHVYSEQPNWRRLVFRAVDLYNRRAARVLGDAVERFGADVVHTHAVPGLSTAVLMTPTKSSAAHVHHLHDYWLLCRRTTLVRRSGQSCTRPCTSCRAISATRSVLLSGCPPEVVIAPSDAISDRHNGVGWLKGRVRRLDHPVDRSTRERTRPVPNAGAPVTFGYLGQLTALKGVDTLLRAFTQLAGNDHRLLVAGRGSLMHVVARGGPRVTALGWVEGEAKEKFYDDIDCLVIPSEWLENAPLVALEALGHGIPVIGARIGGIPELLDPHSLPLLFASADQGSLHASLARFASEPARFAPIGQVGLSWTEHIAALTDLYREAVAGHKDRATRRTRTTRAPSS